MRSKSLIAGALGVLLIFAGQSAAAQEDTLPVPDKTISIHPVPNRDGSILSVPDQDGSTLSAPNRDGSVLSPPDGNRSTLPVPDASAFPPPEGERSSVSAPLPSTGAPSAARVTGAAGPVNAGQARPAASGAAPAQRQERNVPPPAADTAALPRERGVPDRGMFWGLSAGMSMRSYNTGDTDLKNADIKERGPAINGTLFFGMDFGLLTGQAEIILTNEQAEIDTVNIDISGMSLLVPFIFKVDFHLGPVVLQPLAGLYLNFALGKLETRGMGIEGEDPYANPLFGLMFGGSAGISLGRGILFLDSRYAMDLGRTVAGNDPKTIWRRSALMFNLGYQFSIRSGR